MRRLAFAIPGRLDAPTGGTFYDRKVIDELTARGIDVAVIELPESFPFPDATEIAETLRRLAAVPDDIPLLIDGLAFGALPAQGLWALGRDLIVVLHHPLALETGLSDVARAALLESEREALFAASGVIVTSETTRATVAEMFGLDPAAIAVALPGTEARAPVDLRPGPPHLLAVGTLSPRKAQHLLIEALAGLADLDWRLTLAGADDRAPAYAADLRAAIAASGLGERITVTGALPPERLMTLYASADVFVHPALYEGYGIAVADALAHGLPLIAARAGAIPEVVGGAGDLVEAGDGGALAAALRSVISDPRKRGQMRDLALARARALPRWADAAAVFEQVLARFGGAA